MTTEKLSIKSQAFKKKILSDDEVTYLVTRLKQAFGEQLAGFVEGVLSIEDNVRYWAVSARLVELREQQQKTIKQVAAALKVPQYRIKDIEGESPHAVQSEILVEYVHYLGLDEWFTKWNTAHNELWERLQSRGPDT